MLIVEALFLCFVLACGFFGLSKLIDYFAECNKTRAIALDEANLAIEGAVKSGSIERIDLVKIKYAHVLSKATLAALDAQRASMIFDSPRKHQLNALEERYTELLDSIRLSREKLGECDEHPSVRSVHKM